MSAFRIGIISYCVFLRLELIFSAMASSTSTHFRNCNGTIYSNNNEQSSIVDNEKVTSENTVSSESSVLNRISENGQTDGMCQFPFAPPGRTCLVSCQKESDCTSIPGLYVVQYTVLYCTCDTDYTLTTDSAKAYCINGMWFPETPQCVFTEELTSRKAIEYVPTVANIPESSSLTSDSQSFGSCRYPLMSPGLTCSVNCQQTSECSPISGSYIRQYAVLSCVCDHGYTLVTEYSTAYCINGMWFSEVPRCVAALYDSSIISTSSPTQKASYSSVIPEEKSLSSSSLSSTKTTTPVPSSSPISVSSEMVPVGMCKIPILSPNGKCSIMCEQGSNCPMDSYVSEFTVLSCSCNPGYSLSTGFPQVYCTAGSWLPNIPRCA